MVDMGYTKKLARVRASGGIASMDSRIAHNGSSLAPNGVTLAHNGALSACKQAQAGALLAAPVNVTPPPRFMLVFA
jgi:hypothetical protein